MEIFEEIVSTENCCLGLGFFDGVHIGHKTLIESMVNTAQKLNSRSVILTFKTSPAEKFINNVKYLTTNEEKEELLSALGVDFLFETDFDNTLMNMSAEEYLDKIIFKNFKPTHIFTGFNHTFGKGKTGNSTFLRSNQKEYNYTYKEIEPIRLKAEIVSSSLIRTTLETGDIKKANSLLGHNFKISGTVIKGNQIGQTIGFPTANIEYPYKKVEIPFGAYISDVEYNGKHYKGILNFGIKPSINNGENKPVAEVHIIGFNSIIYGEKITISVLDNIRKEQKFNSLEELREQINKDLAICLEWS